MLLYLKTAYEFLPSTYCFSWTDHEHTAQASVSFISESRAIIYEKFPLTVEKDVY